MQQQTKETSSPVKNQKHIRPTDTVTVYSTDKDPYRKTGEGYEVLKPLADKLVSTKKASLEPISEKPSKTKAQ